jgi:Fumarylacetoacetate (FAA) hydrolase family
MGPWVVTPEEVPDPDDLALGCSVDGETVQAARTSDLVFSVPRLPTYAPADPAHAVDVAGFRTFRQVAFFGTFEGQTTLGLGVRARLPLRVFVLSGPADGSRVVIDVAHHW